MPPFTSIFAFFASVFFNVSGLRSQSNNPAVITANTYDGLRLSIGFGAANAVFSALAYFLIEPRTGEHIKAQLAE